MAKKKQDISLFDQTPLENILNESLDNVMGDRYAVYAKYVIQDRAIPDVRDGLKPVQRRIIYSMYQTNCTYDKPTRKCAKIVGDVMGRFHPHGDSSIYEALVRMSQDWKMSMPFITFQGNNGSIDSDPAAAYRYTEAKLNQFSETLISDIDKNTVDMTLNFDDTEFEPTVLPCRYPNLFVNGSDGIAVAIATQIPPHNLNEMCEAAIYRIQHSHCSLDELLEIVKGPDFPTGGVLYKTEGIKEIYQTGRGKVEVASKVQIDTSNKNYNEIIVTEIPYGVVKKMLVYSIDLIKKDKNVDGVVDVKDLSAGDEIKIVIELKKEANPDVILAYLMNKTQLKVNYSANIVAICDKHPRTLGLIEYLDYYIAYQVEVITRRSEFILEKSKNRLEIVEGLIKAISIIEEVIKTIRASKDKADAKVNLMNKFGFSEPQVEAIVTMPLYRLTNTDVQIYINERDNLLAQIKDLEETLASPAKLKRIIINDLNNIIKTYNTPRRTQIEEKQEQVQFEKRDLIAKEDVHVVITADGYVKRITERAYKANIGTAPGVKQNDRIVMCDLCSTVDYIICITSKGNYLALPVHEIAEGKWKDEGKHMNYMCNLPLEEQIVKCFIIRDFTKDVSLATVTKKGIIKKTSITQIPEQKTNRPVSFSKVGKDDSIADAAILHNETDVVIITNKGYISYYSENDITQTNVRTMGVKGISNQKYGDVVALLPFEKKERGKILMLTDKGFVKIMDINTVNYAERLVGVKQYLKSFKSAVHEVIYATKTEVNPSEPLYLSLLLDNGNVFVLKVDDFHVTNSDRVAKKTIDDLSDEDVIKGVYTEKVAIVDSNTKVGAKKEFFSAEPEELTEEVKGEENSSLTESITDSQEIRLFEDPEPVVEEVKEEKKEKVFVPQLKSEKKPRPKKEKKVEEFSIFDEMGD